MGSALGTGVGVLVALLFMAGVYALNRGMILRRVQRDRHEHVDSYGQIFKTITLVVTPFILSTAVYNLSSTVNNSIYTKWYPSLRNLDTVSIYEKYGIFSGQSLTMSNIPIAFASAMASAMIPSVAQLMAARDVKGAREKIGLAVKTTMVISIPCAVGLFVLAKPVISLLFTNKTAEELNLAAALLMTLSLSVIFYALSGITQFFFSGFNTAIYAIIPDCVEYGEWKTGLRNDGFQYAFISLGNKIGMAIGTALLAGLLGKYGYVANQTQNAAVLSIMKHAFTTIPGILWIVTAVVLFFYRLNKKRYNEIVEDLKNGKRG